MNLTAQAAHQAAGDQLVINEATRHQYYVTMQAEACDEDMLDTALNRRQMRALSARRERRRVAVWLAVVSVFTLLGLAWALT